MGIALFVLNKLKAKFTAVTLVTTRFFATLALFHLNSALLAAKKGQKDDLNSFIDPTKNKRFELTKIAGAKSILLKDARSFA